MKTTVQLLADVKRRHGLKSDYALGKLLDIDRSTISAYQSGRRKLTDPDCLKVAAALDIDPGAVLLAVVAERTESEDTRKAVADALKRLGGLAAGVLLVISSLGGPTPPSASAATPGALASPADAAVRPEPCVLCQIVRRLLELASPALRIRRRRPWRWALAPFIPPFAPLVIS